MLKRLYVTAALLLTVVGAVRAQYDASFSHYWDLETYYNPAAAGKEAKLNIVGVYALDFAGYENNPRSMYFAGDMPVRVKNTIHGLGVSLFNDQIGLFQHQRFALMYSYKQKLFGGVLSGGVQAGLLSESFDGSDLDLEDSSDPAFSSSEVDGSSFDLGFGLYYTRGRWYVGLSGQHLTAPLVELGETNELQIDRTYYLTGGYNIKLRNPFLTIPVTTLVKTDTSDWRADITGRLVYRNDKKFLYGGLTYSPDHSFTVLVGGSFHGIQVGYSYEVYTSEVSVGNGSHELFVSYQMDIDLYKKGKNKHKSVRIL